MLEQPKNAAYHDGFNEYLVRHVPPQARRILEVGCARGRLGQELKRLQPDRRVVGIEVDPAAAAVAAQRLDEVHVRDVEAGLADLEPASFDCVIFGDVLEHLIDPESVLRAVRALLAPGGLVLACVPNISHLSIVKALLRADPMYQPSGLLDATHLRFFSHATFIKMLLDAGLLPDILDTIRSGGTEHAIPAATPLLQYFGVPASRALATLDTYQYVFAASALPPVDSTAAVAPISFAVLINDEDQLQANLLRSPCLWEGTGHELIRLPGRSSAAAGLQEALAQARHDVVVLVQQDVYLPQGWDRRFRAQYAQAATSYGRLGVAGLFGLQWRSGAVRDVGKVVDRDRLLDPGGALPTQADGIDEIVLALPADTALQPDRRLGFHLYGADLCLQAAELGLANVVLDAPAYHNSLFADVDAAYHDARQALLDKWPHIRPLRTNMGVLDEMSAPVPAAAGGREADLDQLRERLARAEAQLADVLNSRTWRLAQAVNRRLGRG